MGQNGLHNEIQQTTNDVHIAHDMYCVIEVRK